MNDPDVYNVERSLGRAHPTPWYWDYFQIAERLNCKPWELIDADPLMAFWIDAARIVINAENEHARYQQEQANKASSK